MTFEKLAKYYEQIAKAQRTLNLEQDDAEKLLFLVAYNQYVKDELGEHYDLCTLRDLVIPGSTLEPTHLPLDVFCDSEENEVELEYIPATSTAVVTYGKTGYSYEMEVSLCDIIHKLYDSDVRGELVDLAYSIVEYYGDEIDCSED